MIKRWDQFSVIHRSYKMMKYVDALNRFYGPEISTHLKVSTILRQEDKFIIPKEYDHTKFHTLDGSQNIGKDQAYKINNISSPILTNEIIQTSQSFNNTLYPDDKGSESATSSIIISLILVHNTSRPQRLIPLTKTYNSPIFQTIDNIIFQWLYIDCANVSTTIWDKRH